MSWQSHVDKNPEKPSMLFYEKRVSDAAILGQQGGIWAISDGFNLKDHEQTAIVNAAKALEQSAEEALAKVRSEGLKIGETKYFTTHAEEGGRSIFFRKGSDGAILVKTKGAIIFAIYKAPSQAQDAASNVNNLADYLISAGF